MSQDQGKGLTNEEIAQEICDKAHLSSYKRLIVKALDQAIASTEERMKSQIRDLVLDDVPHQYQKRLLEALK